MPHSKGQERLSADPFLDLSHAVSPLLSRSPAPDQAITLSPLSLSLFHCRSFSTQSEVEIRPFNNPHHYGCLVLDPDSSPKIQGPDQGLPTPLLLPKPPLGLCSSCSPGLKPMPSSPGQAPPAQPGFSPRVPSSPGSLP